MNGKKARKLRKITIYQVDNFEDNRFTNNAYKDLKQLYKNRSIKLHK
jgi:basic membrane lipoprotein Med (substrate-binding protein (PBP1-ABC) superfamily)